VTDLGRVPDTLVATQAALQQAAEHHDLVLTSGGVSVGEEDHVKPAVQALGSLDLCHIAIKPGKPFALGRLNRQAQAGVSTMASDEMAQTCDAADAAVFMGLPGNPVASWVTFLMLVRPYLLRLQGVMDVAPIAVDAVAAFAWPVADQRREFLRVRRRPDGQLELFPHQGSGVLTSAAWADGLVDNPPGRTIQPGDTVRVISIASCW
jgi:molybdopterin molybdotransferase